VSIEDCFKVGYISKTHGLKGEVTAIFDQDFELDEITSLFLEFNGSLVPYFLEDFSDRGDKSFLKFESIDSIKRSRLPQRKVGFSPQNNSPQTKTRPILR